MNDASGRPYVKASSLVAGQIVQVDDGFTCIAPWRKRKGLLDPKDDPSAFYIRCGGPVQDDAVDDNTHHCPQSHRHYLGGQLAADGDSLIGVYPA